jgi:ubiquitin thioesterase OTU1
VPSVSAPLPCPFIAHAIIELSIFSRHYRAEIASIDVETGRIDRFGEDSSYASRVILLYSGIHYDATSLAPTPGAPLDFHETLFPVGNVEILTAAERLAGKLREQKKFTNTATFLLKCEVCLFRTIFNRQTRANGIHL